MEYNTQKAPVRMKAYGREVQLRWNTALTLSDRAERTAYAARIVEPCASSADNPPIRVR